MEKQTAAIRYQRWAQIIQDWGSSGLSKRDYCQEKGIDEKRFYYYQNRIRSLLAAQTEEQTWNDGNAGMMTMLSANGKSDRRPQIVKLRLDSAVSFGTTPVHFSVNGMNFSVPENIPEPFLAKLLEAARHGSH